MPRSSKDQRGYRTVLALVVGPIMLATACGNSGTASSPTGSGSGSTPSTASSSSGGVGANNDTSGGSRSKPTGKPLEKLRIGNFYTAKGGGPGPSLDVYEYRNVDGNVPVAILKDVAYGTISDYVDPPTYSDVTGRGFQLGLAPAGTKVKALTDLKGIGGVGTNPPEYNEQATILLTADLQDQSMGGNDLLPGMSSGPYVEKPGPTEEGSTPVTLPKAVSGGQLLLHDATDASQSTVHFLQIDGACTKAADDPSSDDGVPTMFGVYDVSPGSHQLTMGVGTDPSGLAPTSCDAIKKIGDGTVDAPAGKQVLVVYYSSDGAQTIHFASAVIGD